MAYDKTNCFWLVTAARGLPASTISFEYISHMSRMTASDKDQHTGKLAANCRSFSFLSHTVSSQLCTSRHASYGNWLVQIVLGHSGA